MQKKLKILVFGQSFLGKIGGVQQSYAWLYEYLTARGHKIIHYTHFPVGDKGFYYKFPTAVNVDFINIMFSSNRYNLIRDIAFKHDPDVILVVNSGSRALPFVLALRKTPYPVVLSERGSPEYCLSALWGNRRLYDLATYCTEFKHFLMPSYPEILPPDLRSRARVISSLTLPASIFAQPEKSDDRGRFVILYTGRFSVEKRLKLLVNAFRLIAKDFPLWDLALVGEGGEWEEVKRLVNSYGLSSRIFLPGRVDNPECLSALYAGAHLFVLPSSHEGCPLALREAMAHGLPVIGFASCSGTNEIIHDGHNGLLVSDDDEYSLANALIELARQPEKRMLFGKAGREDVEQFSPEKTHAAWEALLYEGAAWKGKKFFLRWKRFFSYPLRSLCNSIQVWAVEKRETEPWTGSLLYWLKEVIPFFRKYVLLNSVRIPMWIYKFPPRKSCKYTSNIIEYLHNYNIQQGNEQSSPVTEYFRKTPSLLSIVRNRLRLAILYGIDINSYSFSMKKKIMQRCDKSDD